MSIPTTVTTVTVDIIPMSAGPVTNVAVSIVPTIQLNWALSGQSLISMLNERPYPGWARLPAVDQDGFVTADTGATAVRNWSYIIQLTYTDAAGVFTTKNGSIQVFSNQQQVYLQDGGSGTLTSPTQTPILTDQGLATMITGSGSATKTALLAQFAHSVNSFLPNAAGAVTIPAAPSFTPTAVKTTAYGAVVQDLIPCDATTAAVTVSLPVQPADKSRVCVKKIDATTNAVTVTATGTDVLEKAGGGQALVLSILNQSVTLQYAATPGIWYVTDGLLALSALDARYASTAQAAAFAMVLGGF